MYSLESYISDNVFIQQYRIGNTYEIIEALQECWKDEPEMARVVIYAALYYAGHKNSLWLRKHLPNHAQEIINRR